MNFQYIPGLETSKTLLDAAFGSAQQKNQQKRRGNPLVGLKQREGSKVDVIQNILTEKLQKITDTFPAEKALPPFYLKLVHLTLDYPLYKKSLGAVHWAARKISALQREYAQKIQRAATAPRVKQFLREYYGRVSSLLKQIDPHLKYLEKARRIMRTYPDVKEIFTVCLYGFPNVGKTTLLNKLTGSRAKVAAYAFTTVTINSGFMKGPDYEIQVLDVPGTLARREKMNPIELQAELVRTDLTDMVVYVFDLSGFSGYAVNDQEELFKRIQDKDVLVYVSKQDITEPHLLKNFRQKVYSLEELREQILARYAPREKV